MQGVDVAQIEKTGNVQQQIVRQPAQPHRARESSLLSPV